MKNFIIICLAIFGLQISVAFSQCTITQTNSSGTTYTFSIGQSWVATCSGNLSNIVVNTGDELCTGSLTLSIYNGESIAPGDLIYSQAISLLLSPSDQTIEISGNCPVVNGNQYTFVISTSPDNDVYLRFQGSDVYTDGKMYYEGLGFDENHELYFSIFISPVNHIPTLPQWGLILLGAVFAGFGGWFVWKKV